LSSQLIKEYAQCSNNSKKKYFEALLLIIFSVFLGYPVLRNSIEFKVEGRAANREDWQSFTMATKMTSQWGIQDVLRFISQYTGGLAAGSSAYRT